MDVFEIKKSAQVITETEKNHCEKYSPDTLLYENELKELKKLMEDSPEDIGETERELISKLETIVYMLKSVDEERNAIEKRRKEFKEVWVKFIKRLFSSCLCFFVVSILVNIY
jgi:hypothetical protein